MSKLLPLKHLQNKEKGGLGVLREHGHNEDEDAANEDPGVNSDNEEEDEFKVDSSNAVSSATKSDSSYCSSNPQSHPPSPLPSLRQSASQVQQLQSAEENPGSFRSLAELNQNFPELNKKPPRRPRRGPAPSPVQILPQR